MVAILRFLLRQKLRIDVSEPSLICRGRSGWGHVGSTTRCVLVQHWMLWHSLSHTGPPPSSFPTTWLRIVPMLVYEEFAIESQPKHVFLRSSQIDVPEAVLLPGGLVAS